ncbi:uncharacterized protein LOC120722563 [Simochromis diagramma]|uniref:uncharacterized protein LOC120722563 n=1 Tax=Simochromis diagramma TaxID=43689 RepID=UPI001A7E8CE2|nr:uncharacterized protein LOC120722563 [Simochromis diagramma]
MAEAEAAALMVRQKLLKDKHALEEHEAQLRRQREQLELETNIAATVAKMKVLKGSKGSSIKSKLSKISDGMESYFEKGQKVTQMLNTSHDNPVRERQHVHIFREHNVADSQSLLTTGRVPIQPQTLSEDPLTYQSDIRNSRENKHVPSQISSHEEDCNILSVMSKQNELTALLIQQHSLSSLPKKEIPVFDGDPLQYQTFIKSFEHNIESRNKNPGDCLYYLEQHTKGQPRELVRSCLHMTSEAGFRKAKCLLRQHFGNEHKLATAYMSKALAWSSIKAEDTKALHAYSIFLRGCCNAMEDLSYMQELDMPANMLAITKKLPYRQRDKWRTAVCDFHEKCNRQATFKDLVEFLEKQVKIASDPVFGDIKDICTTNRDTRKLKSQTHTRFKESYFATSVMASEKENNKVKEKERTAQMRSCLFCKGEHTLENCQELERKTQKDKITFLKENGVCFGCLCKGHISRDCKKRLRCKTCGLKHPQMLHIYQKTMSKEQESKEQTQNRAIVSIQTSALTGAGKDEFKLSIVPVKVKAKKGNVTLYTYAFLDPGSTASFCTVKLMNKLKMHGRRSNILLRTMGQNKVVETDIIADLEVAGLDGKEFCDLPILYTQFTKPVHKGNIPHQNDIIRWPYLKSVNLPEIDSEIDLLIGSNVPKALEPLDVIRSVGDGPYAVKTVLGWTVNGPLGETQTEVHNQPQISVNRVSVVKLDELWNQQFKTDFPECARDEKEPSKEDQQFLDKVSNTAKLHNGHYYIGLPLKDLKVCMPDNKSVAEQRLQNLKKRLMKNSTFLQDYNSFMSDMISEGYAEKVPEDNLERTDGRKWYLPHHGVLHPQKKTLRVVFDCGVKYQGVSLNSKLLQGPDLTSMLIGVLTRFRKEPVVIAADIKAMFHQVKIPEEDQDMLRFLCIFIDLYLGECER